MKEIVSNLETVRRALQDFLAPELRGIAVRLEAIDERLEAMSGNIAGVRDELRSGQEARTAAAMEGAEREAVLTVRLAESKRRHAELLRQLGELEQKAPH